VGGGAAGAVTVVLVGLAVLSVQREVGSTLPSPPATSPSALLAAAASVAGVAAAGLGFGLPAARALRRRRRVRESSRERARIAPPAPPPAPSPGPPGGAPPAPVAQRLAVGMRARALTVADDDPDADQKAWMRSMPDRHWHLVRVVVSFDPRPQEAVLRARVVLSLAAHPASPQARPLIWSVHPRQVAAETRASTRVSVGANLKVVDVARETSSEAVVRTLQVEGSGELQPQTRWLVTGTSQSPLTGDHSFVAVLFRSHPTVATLWVAYEVERDGRSEVYEASLAPDDARLPLD